ncbi:(2Fe-2S)-binding protein [Pseudonocardia sp. GCM10023141]|uniref:(2Fe-2S)-binding protein n=1 Tax=Pseudonocardia sp. GCM10023141 TaxID=3252653 RepID=UPI00360F80AA
MDARGVLADVARLGPFFAVATNPAESVDPTWRPLRDLYTDPVPLRDRIAHVRRTLGSDERVAASIAFQGLAARILSAPFAAVVLHGVLPGWTPDAVHWRASASGPWPLWTDAPLADGTDVAAAVVEEHMVPLVAAVRAQVAISEQILWGSVASSVSSARGQVATRRPAAAARATALAEELLSAGRLAGSAELRPFRRRSCCLYYRVPGGGLCGDCVLQSR